MEHRAVYHVLRNSNLMIATPVFAGHWGNFQGEMNLGLLLFVYLDNLEAGSNHPSINIEEGRYKLLGMEEYFERVEAKNDV